MRKKKRIKKKITKDDLAKEKALDKKTLKYFLIVSGVVGAGILLFYQGMLGSLINWVLVIYIGIFLPLALIFEGGFSVRDTIGGIAGFLFFLFALLFVLVNFEFIGPLFIMIFSFVFLFITAHSIDKSEDSF